MKKMKWLAALLIGGGMLVLTDSADARHRGGREVVKTRTVVRGAPSRSVSRSVVRVDAGFSHHNSFNSFRGFGDPCYCGDEVVEIREVRRFSR